MSFLTLPPLLKDPDNFFIIVDDWGTGVAGSHVSRLVSSDPIQAHYRAKVAGGEAGAALHRILRLDIYIPKNNLKGHGQTARPTVGPTEGLNDGSTDGPIIKPTDRPKQQGVESRVRV